MRSSADTVDTLDAGPRAARDDDARLAPRIELLFHAELGRTGEIAPLDPGGRELVIGRKTPDFRAITGGAARPIGDRFVSREQLAIAWRASDRRFAIRPFPAARLACDVLALDGGAPPQRLDRPLDVPPGAIVAIGDRALILLAAGAPRATDAPRMGMIGESDLLWSVRDRIAAVASFRQHVLVLGETGTGKELVARALHDLAGSGPFLAVNMGGLDLGTAGSELFGHARGAFTGADRDAVGAFEAAGAGTVFLDEIGDAPPEIQKKLLRVLEERRFSPIGGRRRVDLACRVVAATNRPLGAEIASGDFRRDLYERIAALTIALPPLRRRREDIARLFVAFLRRESDAHPAIARLLQGGEEGADPPVPMSAILALLAHPWTGNIRELRNHATATAAANLGGARFTAVPLDAAPAEAPAASDRAASPPMPDAAAIEAALAAARGNVRAASAKLGCSRYQLYRWMESRGVTPDRFRG